MTKPVTIPNTFATATTAIPLSQLDSDFSTVATALNDANTYSNYAADTGVANAYVVTLTGVSTTYSAGLRIQFKAGASNTGASTLNVNGGGTKNITFQDASALSSGTIAANAIVDVMYDGTQFLLMNDPAGATGGDVVGPASATDNAIVRFDGATGKLVQNSVVTIADSTGDISGVGTLNATTLDATNIEVTNIKAKDGTAAASIADSTGVISVTANPVLSGGTANGVLYLNGSKVATSGSALTFDGTNLGVGNSVATTVNNNNGSGTLVVGTDSGSTGMTILSGASSGNEARLTFANATTGAGSYAAQISYKSGDAAILFFNNNAERYRIATDGSATWTVAGSETMRLTSTGLKSSIAGTNADPVFSYTSDTNTGIFFPAADKLGFTAGGGTDQMVLTTTGLGIGTSSPNQKLEVSGNIQVTATNKVIFNDGGGTDCFIGRSGAQTLVLGTASADRLILDSSGNLGLGVTPSAWQSGYTVFQVINTSIFTSGTTDLNFGQNVYINSGGNYTYISNGYATLYNQYAGKHFWSTAPSGTAGNAITFTQAMTLSATGGLSIGNTNDAGQGNLSVGGTGANFVNIRSANGSGQYLFLTESGVADRWLLGSNAGSGDLVFRSGAYNFSTGTERARITSGGYFCSTATGTLFGTTSYNFSWSDAQRFYLYHASATAANAYGIEVRYNSTPNGTGNEFLYCTDTNGGTLRASVRSNGGLANYQSNNVDLSDARTKKDITPAPSYWNKIAALEIVTYKYNDQTHDDINVGVIAQQVESVEPVWVDADGFGKTPEDGVPLKTVYTKDITFAAIKALQEAMARIETLEAKVSALEGN